MPTYRNILEQLAKDMTISGYALAEDLMEWMSDEMLEQFVKDYAYEEMVLDYANKIMKGE